MASDPAAQVFTPSSAPAGLPALLHLSQSVSHDLEAIFGDAGSLAVRPPSPRVKPAAGRMGARAHRKLPASLGALTAVALAGVAVGSLLPRPNPAPHAATVAPPVATPSVAAAPPLQTPQELDAALARPLRAAAPRPARAPRAHRVPVQVRSRDVEASDQGYAEIRAADRRLRESYEAAVRAGVPREEVIAAHERWDIVRVRSADDPRRLASAYRDIAEDLDRASARARTQAANPPDAPRTIRTRFHSRYPAWWF